MNKKLAAAITAAGIFAVSCGSAEADAKEFTIVGASSQTVAQSAWINSFSSENKELDISYDPQGSGAGRSRFSSGASDAAGTDVPLNEAALKDEYKGCKAGPVQVPIYISSIAIAYNLEGVDELLLDAEALAGIFSGAITRWDDERITAINPQAQLPAREIVAVHRSDASGTTENFADYLRTNVPEIWSHEPGTNFPYASGEAAKGSSGVAQIVKKTNGAVGYLDASVAGGMKWAKLKVGEGYSTLSSEGAQLAVADSPLNKVDGQSLVVKPNRSSTKAGAWPLLLVSYALACQEYRTGGKGALARSYFGYATSEAAQKLAAEQAGSAPLPAELIKSVQEIIQKIK